MIYIDMFDVANSGIHAHLFANVINVINSKPFKTNTVGSIGSRTMILMT